MFAHAACSIHAVFTKLLSKLRLGVAFMDGTTLCFCEAADPAPDFLLLQAAPLAVAVT
tara:strand:- start:377 stop:550 length:174 start_codon:yes stop_codon:yes gene_type:complete